MSSSSRIIDDDNFDTSLLDTAALDLASELEKTAVCNIAAALVKEKVVVTSAPEFWDRVSARLADYKYDRKGLEARYLFRLCLRDGRQIVNSRRYIQSEVRRLNKGEKAWKEPPQSYAPNPDLHHRQEDSNRYPLQSMAQQALGLMEEREKVKSAEANDAPHQMSFRGKGRLYFREGSLYNGADDVVEQESK